MLWKEVGENALKAGIEGQGPYSTRTKGGESEKMPMCACVRLILLRAPAGRQAEVGGRREWGKMRCHGREWGKIDVIGRLLRAQAGRQAG